MGDGESMEGSNWEAAEIARHYQLDNLCAIVDINRLGQSDPTLLQHDVETYRSRWSAFGWNAIPVDGHDIAKLLDAFAQAARTKGRPTVVLARTLKGKGISFVEDKPDWHGKPLKKGEEADKALAELSARLLPTPPTVEIRKPDPISLSPAPAKPVAPPEYAPTDFVATREAFGATLVKLGEANPRVVVLDADVKNSTFTDKFAKKFPERFFEIFIAEQNMIGISVGLASQGKIPFAATFACFLTRAYDFIRMAAISRANIKLMGSHVGVSIGEDGPSQMGLDELAKQGIAIRVVDLYSIVPIDRATLLACARATNNLILTVEDHYAHGGVGDAVLAAVNADGVKVHKLAVTEIPHSGKPEQLLDRYGISARHIVDKVKKLAS